MTTATLGIIFALIMTSLLVASIIVGIRDGEDYARRVCPKSGRRCIGVRCAHYVDCEVAK